MLSTVKGIYEVPNLYREVGATVEEQSEASLFVVGPYARVAVFVAAKVGVERPTS